METILVSLGARSYPIHIGQGLLSDTALIGRSIPARQVLIVTNEVVAPLYLAKLQQALPVTAQTLVLPDGEQHKTLATFARICDTLIEHGFHRDATIVALGGGVVGDVTGFAAASYQRGIDFVQIPTTLLAQVDSSVGGKTAVNHPRAKNMIGAFYQPSAVIADIDTLATLPRREFAAGLAEVIKYGLIVDHDFFIWLEHNIDALLQFDPASLIYAVRRCCEIKADVVGEDERERGRRALLNLGHTFGHGLEALAGYGTLLHGEAVAIGTSLAARTSAALGMLPSTDCERIDALLHRAGLPTSARDYPLADLLVKMQLDKKASSSGLKLILLEAIGRGVVTAAPQPERLRAILAEHCAA